MGHADARLHKQYKDAIPRPVMPQSSSLLRRIQDLNLTPYLLQGIDTIAMLQKKDTILIAKLTELNKGTTSRSENSAFRFFNKVIATKARVSYSPEQLEELEVFLTKKGTFEIQVIDQFKLKSQKRPTPFVAATTINASDGNHGEMSSMLYLRDHIQVADAYMRLFFNDPTRYKREGEIGHILLLSALDLMSTPSQLHRFKTVITTLKEKAGQEDWPQISLWFNDLDGERPNGWRNKQDTFQMLTHTTCEALSRGFLNTSELADSHKEFLRSIVPFLKAVGYPRYDSSGSWEEVAAHRTSVMAVETAALSNIQLLIAKDARYSFLRHDPHQTIPVNEFDATLHGMIFQGLTEIGQRLPFESPDYDSSSVLYRTIDANSIYVLTYDIPRLLETYTIPIGKEQQPLSSTEIEDRILAGLTALNSSTSGGLIRYKDDSYQGVNFHTEMAQAGIHAIKRKILSDAEQTKKEPNFIEKQSLRGKLIPKKHEAAWTHPLGELAAWSATQLMNARKNNDSHNIKRYALLYDTFINRTLSTITGENQFHATLNANGHYVVQPVPAYKVPECLITYKQSAEEVCIVPSPHTPLNWSTAMLQLALGLGISTR